ncbi:MAG: hypothetical protein MR352_08775, partial [Ruminococcus sp.]
KCLPKQSFHHFVVPLPLHKGGWLVSANSKYLPQNKVNSNSTNPNLSILPLHTDKIKKIKKLIFSPTQLKGEIYIIIKEKL